MTITPPEIKNAVHLCVDMQNIFAKDGPWATPWMDRVIPKVVAITERHTARTVFTRFITPASAQDRPGRWQHYYSRWPQVTRENLLPEHKFMRIHRSCVAAVAHIEKIERHQVHIAGKAIPVGESYMERLKELSK